MGIFLFIILCMIICFIWGKKFGEGDSGKTKLKTENGRLESSKVKVNLLDLNDDCLNEIFNKCDEKTLISLMDTCRRMEEIIKSSVFPNSKKLNMVIYKTHVCI